MVSLSSFHCPLSTHVVFLYIITNCKLLDALEGNNNKELSLKEVLPSRGKSTPLSGAAAEGSSSQ